MKKLIAVLVISVLALTACGSGGGEVKNLGVIAFSQKVADKSIIRLDVRTPNEFASGHLDGAINIDWESGHFEADINALDKSKSYAVYCRSGNRSGQATSLMVHDGFKTVYNLKGGVADWVMNGLALVTN